MPNILIADSGSTKTEWVLLQDNFCNEIFSTPGINPYYQNPEEILKLIQPEFEKNIHITPDYIYFYGAGCGNPQKQNIVGEAIQRIYSNSKIFIEGDLLGAARSLCQTSSGIACILGTGSNSCYYNGKEIVSNISPLGYILGDEGSGAVMGKRLISDILKNQLPEIVAEKFFDTYKLDVNSILDSAYKQPFPNRYLAQFSKFVHENITLPGLENIVMEGFEAFITRNILQYEKANSMPIYFTGSVAFFFQDQLIKAMASFHLKPEIITRSPLKGLIKYHQQ
jgi:N-acetylglucosamine kinase-like BadF-type ATPase